MQSHPTSKRKALIVGTALTAGCLAFVGFHSRDRFLQRHLPVLKVDYPDNPIRTADWDPARSKFDFEISMVQALYSPLLEMDNNAQLKSGWAESFRWQDRNTVTFQLRRDHYRADGKLVTAGDAMISLKRLAFLQQDEDAFYVEQFCHTQKLASMRDPCPGLKAEDQTLTIQTRDPVAILPQLLTEVDTSLVPADALAADGVTLKDNPPGTGPYYRETQSNGQVVFKANPHHFNYNSAMPQEIQLVPSVDGTPERLAEDFKKHKIDHAARFSALNAFGFKILAENLGDGAEQLNTLPMGVGLLLFSDVGRSRFSIAERQELILRLQKACSDCLKAAGQDQVRRPTITLIPPSGVGMLTLTEEAEIQAAREAHVTTALQHEVRIRFPRYIGDQLIPCLSGQLTDLPLALTTDADAEVDLRFKSYDMSTYEELGAIRSMLSNHVLDPENLTPEAWILRYIGEKDTPTRVAYLKAAHRRAIWEDPSVIPLWNFSTGALIRKPWKMKFSPLSISNPFHLIRYAG